MSFAKSRPLLLAVAMTVALAGCSSDDDDAAPTEPTGTTVAPGPSEPTTTTTTTTVPVPLADQTPPAAVNGLVVDGDTIWVASLDSDQILRVDRATGAILTRVSAPGSSPDDVTLGPDGTIYWTGFADGTIGHITGDTSETVANIGAGANPIGFTDDGRLVAGRAVTADGLYLVPLDGGAPELIAETVGDMNAFVIDGDRVIGPVGGALGPGGVSAVDLSTGEVTVLAADFPLGVTASAVDPDGVIHLLSATGQVWRFDEATGTIEEAHVLTGAVYDNLDFAPDGTLYVTHFTEPRITVVAPDGEQTTLDIGS